MIGEGERDVYEGRGAHHLLRERRLEKSDAGGVAHGTGDEPVRDGLQPLDGVQRCVVGRLGAHVVGQDVRVGAAVDVTRALVRVVEHQTRLESVVHRQTQFGRAARRHQIATGVQQERVRQRAFRQHAPQCLLSVHSYHVQ